MTPGKLTGLGEEYSVEREKYRQSLPYQSNEDKSIPEEILGVVFRASSQICWISDYWNFKRCLMYPTRMLR